LTADKKPKESIAVELNDEDVRDYLKKHRDFFERHPDMLDQLHVTHSSGSAVSLVEKQVSVLRERNMDMRKRLNTLTANARENDKLYEQTRGLVLNLLDADSIAGLYRAFMHAMQNSFDVEFASMILFGDASDERDYRVDSLENAKSHIGALLNGRKAICGALRKEEFTYLFPSDGAGHPFYQGGSAAIMPLTDGTQLGLIAVGCSDANRYTSDMGVLFLSHIAEVILRLMQRFSRPEA